MPTVGSDRRAVRRSAALAGMAALVLGGCAVAAGPIGTEDRDVGQVTGIELSTSGDVVVLHGDRPKLTVTAPQSVLGRLTSDVADDRLALGSDGAWSTSGRIGYLLETDYIDAVTVRGSGGVTGSAVTGDVLAVTIEGSGDVHLDGLDATDVSVAIDGSGNVELSGAARRLTVVIGGSGSVSAFDLRAGDVEAEVDGSGSVRVNPVGRLDVRIAGSGNVVYDGDPALSTHIAGSGDVVHR